MKLGIFFSLITVTTFANNDVYKLGQSLFFDKLISGNKNISCASCHHPLTGTSDALTLGLGEGALGLGMSRTDQRSAGINNAHERVPRNSPVLWNVGHKSKTRYFHDGRVELNPNFPNGFKTPEGMNLPEGLKDLLAAQALFPITSQTEMAGQGDENDISKQASAGNISGPTGVWRIIEIRLQGNQNYVNAFKKAFPSEIKEKEDIKISHYANAISHYQKETFKSFDSPYDHYIAGDVDAMKESAKRGYEVFTTKGRCFECHTGNLFSDEKFYSLGFPQIGPGKGHGENGLEDFGRAGVTKVKNDRYKFMTPTLRNIALSAPYGHAGTFETLKDVIKAHFQKDGGLSLVNKENLRLPIVEGFRPNDFYVLGKRILRQKILATRDDRVPMLSDEEVEDLVSFLHALTDLNCLDMNLVIPKKVLSGLPVHN